MDFDELMRKIANGTAHKEAERHEAAREALAFEKLSAFVGVLKMVLPACVAEMAETSDPGQIADYAARLADATMDRIKAKAQELGLQVEP